MKRPIKIETLRAGDFFYEESSGAFLKCQALETCRDDQNAFLLNASTPVGDREFYQVKGATFLRLYADE